MTESTKDPQASLYAALAKAQGEFAPLAKNRTVTIKTKQGYSYEFRYADLEAVLTATRPALAANGLAVIQRIAPVAGINTPHLITTLVHADGGHIESAINLPAEQYGDIKNLGAAISYLRRYAYTALVCVAADDDLDEDGQEAGGVQGAGNGQSQQNRAPASQAQQQDAGLPPYSDEQFKTNLPAWRSGVIDGKTTPERIIQMVSSKAVLSPKQVKAIQALAQKNGETQE